MKAMILAAGRGERMRPMSDCVPKPLMRVGGKPLIQIHVENLVAAGLRKIVVNVAHLGEQIEAFLGDGEAWGCQIHYSREPEGALETAGGIHQALPLLGNRPFVLVNGDIWCDYPLKRLQKVSLGEELRAHLVMVNNPAHHPKGDFLLTTKGRLRRPSENETDTLTYSGIALVHPRLVSELESGWRPLGPVLQQEIADDRISGELYTGEWEDVGTPERLHVLDRRLRGL